jgi:hypothetical protein
MENKEQKLIDLMFSMVLAASENSIFCKKPRGEKMAWVANTLREMGFDTHPIGMSWGVLVSPSFRKENKIMTNNLEFDGE